MGLIFYFLALALKKESLNSLTADFFLPLKFNFNWGTLPQSMQITSFLGN